MFYFTVIIFKFHNPASIAGPFVSAMKNASADYVSWMLPICCVMAFLYAVKMVFDHFTTFAGEFDLICLYIHSGSMFPSASVPTFTSSFAGEVSSWYLDFYFCCNFSTVIQIFYYVEF